jgi:hypothetical protein
MQPGPVNIPLTDKKFAWLLDDLTKGGFQWLEPALRANILAFYAAPERQVSVGIGASGSSRAQGRPAVSRGSQASPLRLRSDCD